jgi:hypothetical protein
VAFIFAFNSIVCLIHKLQVLGLGVLTTTPVALVAWLKNHWEVVW